MNNSLRTLAFVIASTIASGASANALDFFKVSTGAMALADEAALQSMFDDGYFTLETFDSLGTAPVTGSNDSLSWENSAASFSTSVGTFTLTTPGLDQAGDDVPDELKIESNATGEHGREVLSMAQRKTFGWTVTMPVLLHGISLQVAHSMPWVSGLPIRMM